MEDKQTIYIYILVASLTAIALFVGLKPLTNATEWILIMDVVLSGVILSGLLILLKNIIQYGYFSSLHIRQKLINYSALAVLFVSCWLGLEFFIMYLSISENEWTVLSHTVPIRIVIALLIYGISIMILSNSHHDEKEIIQIGDTTIKDDEIEILDNELKPETEVEIIERIVVKSGQKIEVIPIYEVIHLQAEGDYVMIHSIKGKFLKEQTMKSLESCLPPDKFVRVHRSSIINIDFIAQIELFDKQSQLLKLKNGSQVKASLAGYKLLKKALGL